jgi:hypothetical protein
MVIGVARLLHHDKSETPKCGAKGGSASRERHRSEVTSWIDSPWMWACKDGPGSEVAFAIGGKRAMQPRATEMGSIPHEFR